MTDEASRSEVVRAEDPLIPWYIVGPVAILSAAVVAAMAILGPLVLGEIEYRTSESGVWQVQGGDIVNLFLIAPILLVGGILHLMRREGSKYLLILTPIALIYTGLSVGIGQEWGDPRYTGNVEQYAWLYLAMVIGGLILLVSTLPLFSERDAPEFGRKGPTYAALMTVFLVMFTVMWLSELAEVMSTGGSESGAYEETPTLWWVIRYFDIGVTIPLGFMALSLLLVKPKRSYPLVLLFFGFFITLGSAVCAMGWVMWANDDPTMQSGALGLFTGLAVLSYVGLAYLVKDKLRNLLSR
jgi:hypothetical protein